jgi:penicillin-binding protein 1A
MFFRRRKARREPRLGTFGTLFAFGLSARDRIGAARSPARGEGAGQPADKDKEKRPRRRRPSRVRLRRAFYWSVVLALWAALAIIGLVVFEASRLPPLATLVVPKRPPTITILGTDNKVIATRGEMGGTAVPLKALPPYLPQAFIAIEDRRFYWHFGLDPIGLARAMIVNITSGALREGGSTITQQLAKNLFLTQERTLARKIQELVLALWLERAYSKNEILELYLNRIYFGAGAYGVEAAAQRYFGKSARAVTLAEAAMLAGLAKSPSRLAPTRNPAAARERAELVLAALVDARYVSEAMARTARGRPPAIVRNDGPGSIGYVADWVMDSLDDYVGALESDVVVQTTIDPALQAAAEAALAEELARQGERFGVAQGALVAMDPDGRVRALVGGRNYGESQFNRAVAARRQPGSAFKPFVYLAALERGLTPETVREDAPIELRGWRPENFSREYFGPVTLITGLSHSLNTVSVRLTLEVGPRSVAAAARRLGIASKLEPNASIALGTSEVTLLELTGAYAPFANGGIGVIPHVIERVRGPGGKILYARAATGPGRVVALDHVAMMNRMLAETLVTGTARRAALPGWPAAGKTGTSQDFRDAWFVGYTGRLIAGVWLGNDDSTPTRRASGANLPVEIWSRFMRAALDGVPVARLPGSNLTAQLAPVAPPTEVPDTPNPERPPAPAGQTLDRWLLDKLFGRR